MGFRLQVLGEPGGDNALLVHHDRGQGITRLLFDCGDCLDALPLSERRAIDALFFSHLHLDHVAGFDRFFRATYDRVDRPNLIWGPPGTARIIQHRFRGALWNLALSMQATWRVHNVMEGFMERFRFELSEAFAAAHPEGNLDYDGPIWSTPEFTVTPVWLDHKTPCLGYVLRETPRHHIDTEALARLQLKPGPWLEALRSSAEAAAPAGATPADKAPVGEDGRRWAWPELRQRLLVTAPGDAVAYLTDFRLDAATLERLAAALKGCREVVCESQYAPEDAPLAAQHYHLTSIQAATIAAAAGVERLTLFHLSDRYPPEQRQRLLAAAQERFSATRFPDHWPVQ